MRTRSGRREPVAAVGSRRRRRYCRKQHRGTDHLASNPTTISPIAVAAASAEQIRRRNCAAWKSSAQENSHDPGNPDARVAEAQRFLRKHLEGAEGVCVTSSFQAEDMVLLHMVRAILPRVPVLFLDTGYHFRGDPRLSRPHDSGVGSESRQHVPQTTVAEQESAFGILHQTAPDRCCALRKVGPLFRALAS